MTADRNVRNDTSRRSAMPPAAASTPTSLTRLHRFRFSLSTAIVCSVAASPFLSAASAFARVSAWERWSAATSPATALRDWTDSRRSVVAAAASRRPSSICARRSPSTIRPLPTAFPSAFRSSCPARRPARWQRRQPPLTCARPRRCVTRCRRPPGPSRAFPSPPLVCELLVVLRSDLRGPSQRGDHLLDHHRLETFHLGLVVVPFGPDRRDFLRVLFLLALQDPLRDDPPPDR